MRFIFPVLLFLTPAWSWAVPDKLVQEGVVMTQAGVPLQGDHDVRVRLYGSEDAALALFDERHEDVSFVDGYYAIIIGSREDLDPDLLLTDQIFVGISIDDQAEMRPRTEMLKVPASFIADVALSVSGDIKPDTLSINGVGQVINSSGEWVGPMVGLRGPEGPRGAQGEQGPVGPPGDIIQVEAADGAFEDLPGRVITLLTQEENPPFLRRNANDDTTGDLIFRGGAVGFETDEPANVLALGNNNIVGVNALSFNDPGPDEGITWRDSAAKIVLTDVAGGEGTERLRVMNEQDVSIEAARVTIDGFLLVQDQSNFAGAVNMTQVSAGTANITNANIAKLNGPNDRVLVESELELRRNVILGDNASFIGTVRAGGLGIAGNGLVQGDFSAGSVASTGNISAEGNIETGFEGLIRAGLGGMFVRDRQVFDGNGNLLARPVYACPGGTIMIGTKDDGSPNCISLTCDGGQVFRGVDNQMKPICAPDDTGLSQVPAIECPEGEAVIKMEPNGRARCGRVRAGEQLCPEGEFVQGLDPDGTVICQSIANQDFGPELRGTVKLCGTAELDIANDVMTRNGVDLKFEESCEPTDQTQAFLITRTGIGGYDAGLLRSYVRAGGIVISEYGNTNTLFQDIFEIAVERGERVGNCNDNINPPVRKEIRNPFWRDNSRVNELQEASGCGYRLDHFPEFTALGGWDEATVSLGYKDLGLGRLWMVESDWQDGTGSFENESATLLAYMMVNGRRDGALFEFGGVRESVSDSRLIGWYPCYTSRYGDRNLSIPDMKQRCNGDRIMMGCRPVGAANWTILAQGARNEVFTDTGAENNVVTRTNGVDWYFNDNWSMGFSSEGTGVSRDTTRCDTKGEPQRSNRLCWNTENNRVMGGYRCGARTGLNDSQDWERAVFTNRLTLSDDIFFSCREAFEAGQEQSGIYDLMPPGTDEPVRVYCDMETDGGGWTLVGSSRDSTLNDQESLHYEDLGSLSPGSAHQGVWNGLRGFAGKFDLRFACRSEIGGATDDMNVDLSFYDVDWYREWTSGNDTNSCFEEGNGQGATRPTPARKDNISGDALPEGDAFNSGFLEGEDTCDDTEDFAIDFDDRGMSGDEADMTNWGEADGCQRCGSNQCLNEGQWFIFAREREVEIPPLNIFDFEGVVQRVSDDEVNQVSEGEDSWCLCHSSRYAQKDIPLNEIWGTCNGEYLMMGCRSVDSDSWSVLAMGEREVVLTDLGNRNVQDTTDHRDVSWYYSEGKSMGFSPIGRPVRLASCDTDNTQGDKKMCWHTEEDENGQGTLAAGWRCGRIRGLNGALDWERAIWTKGLTAAGREANCIPPTACTADLECQGGKTCQNGRCLEPPPECLVERDCPENFSCIGGRCIEILPECAQNTDCDGDNEICFAGECTFVAPAPECLIEDDCGAGSTCCDGTCYDIGDPDLSGNDEDEDGCPDRRPGD